MPEPTLWLAVLVTREVDAAFPGWVEGFVTDADQLRAAPGPVDNLR